MKTKTKILIIIALVWLSPAITNALYQPISIIKTLVQSSMATVYNDLIDTSRPAGSDSPSEADDNMRRIQGGFQEILAVEHNVDLTGTVITGDGTHTALTTDSIVNAGTMTAGGSITLGAGADLIGSATSDITFNTNTFTVAGATGNTAVAGTLDVTGVMTTTAASVLGDGSTLAAATEAGDGDRTIADKVYVDDRIEGNTPTRLNSIGGALVVSVVYTNPDSGFVNGFIENSSGGTSFSLKVAGLEVSRSAVSTGKGQNVFGFVPDGATFELVLAGAETQTPVITWTSLVSGGGAPVAP